MVETNFITECGTSDTQFDDFTNLDVADFFIKPEDNIASLINRKSAQGFSYYLHEINVYIIT